MEMFKLGDTVQVVNPFMVNDVEWYENERLTGEMSHITAITGEGYTLDDERFKGIVFKHGNLKRVEVSEEEYTGGSSSYYKVFVKNPTTLPEPYEAEANDIIEALKLNFAEGNILKALWRRANARNSVAKKKGYDEEGKYDAEKILFFAKRIMVEYDK